MKIDLFSAKPYDIEFFQQANQYFGFTINYLEHQLNSETAQAIKDTQVVCVFVNDNLDRECINIIRQKGVQLIALRCAGFNNVDIDAANQYDIPVVRVPAYSPEAVAEHTLALILGLNRKIHKAYNRVREGNFSLSGLLGFNLQGKTAGIIGTGKIGTVVARMLSGIGMHVLAHDILQNEQCGQLGVEYVELETLLHHSDVISLHCPLNQQTFHLIDEGAIDSMKSGAMLINTSRGAVIDTAAVINGLKKGKIGYLGLDVYEQEGDLFFEDLSCTIIQDDVFERLLSFPNVIITGHQGFFTREALTQIARVSLENIMDFKQGVLQNQVQQQGIKQCVTHSW